MKVNSSMTKDQIQKEIDRLKPILQEFNDEYVHYFARGLMIEAMESKHAATCIFNEIGKLVRKKLAAPA